MSNEMKYWGISVEVGDEICHYGKKGMKWGKRKRRARLIATSDNNDKGDRPRMLDARSTNPDEWHYTYDKDGNAQTRAYNRWRGQNERGDGPSTKVSDHYYDMRATVGKASTTRNAKTTPGAKAFGSPTLPNGRAVKNGTLFRTSTGAVTNVDPRQPKKKKKTR